MSRVFVGIGSNEGDRLHFISQAIEQLNRVSDVHVTQMAVIMETEPVGGPPQGPYLNTVVELQTTLSPIELLKGLKQIEQQLGRTPSTQRWAPRPIDLDMLLYDDCILQTVSLIIPHPRMHVRRFVLEPLAQLAPELIHPVLGQSISTLLVQLGSQTAVSIDAAPSAEPFPDA